MWGLALVEYPVFTCLVWMVMIRCCRVVHICFCILCGFGIALGDDCSHTGGNDDMKFVVFLGGARVGSCGTHICFYV